LPEMRAKATGDDGGDLPCEGRKWGKNRPAGTISREVMRAHILRQEITLLDTLYRNLLSLAMVSRKYVLPFVVVTCLCMDIRGSQDGLK
jgi:hypothetical protein